MNRKIRFTMWLGGLLSLVLGLVAFGQSGSIQTGWFTVDYPQGWSADEESISDEESYAKALFYTGEDLQAADTTVRVTATREDADSFRDTLIGRDISLESYADGSARTVSISSSAGLFFPFGSAPVSARQIKSTPSKEEAFLAMSAALTQPS